MGVNIEFQHVVVSKTMSVKLEVAGGASRACEASLTFCFAVSGQTVVPLIVPVLMEPERAHELSFSSLCFHPSRRQAAPRSSREALWEPALLPKSGGEKKRASVASVV